MKKYKKLVMYSSVLVLVLVLGIFIIGWQEIRSDMHNSVIGKKIMFTESVQKLVPAPVIYTGELLSSKYYGAILKLSDWSNIPELFYAANFDEVSCNEVFVVKDVIFLESKGIIKRVISAGSLKYYVLTKKSSDKEYLVLEGDYEKYTKLFDGDHDNYKCNQE